MKIDNNYDDFDIRVGMNLKEIRIQKNLTQEELGKLMNVTKTQISRWESGKRSMYFETAKQLCKVLDISLQDLGK